MATATATPNFFKQKHNPQLVEAAIALNENRLHDAEPLLRAHLKADPFDVAAIRMMGELAARIGRLKDAESLFRRAVALSPNFLAARSNLAATLYKQNRAEDAVTELDALLRLDPDNAANSNLKAAALGRIGDYEEALTLYAKVLEAYPEQPKIWMSYGHVLKTVGEQDRSIAAYRRALQIAPTLGEVWWSLANLKTVKFEADDIAAMEKALTQPELKHEDRLHLHFALGKATEDAQEIDRAFAHYDVANQLRAEELGYEPAETTAHVAAAIKLFTPEFFAARVGLGCDAADPIFILGLPRAGSTLIEQILSSHSAIEGTMELPDIPAIAATFGDIEEWPGRIAALRGDELRSLGESYLTRTRVQRKSGKPYFIDKLPNNWAHIGLIQLILPNAKIIDARRHPLGSCFSNFKQHFARGQAFTYGLENIGHYYADYIDHMRHFDRVLPGRVHRVIYEKMVEETEEQVRALLSAVHVPFEAACLRFWENDRAVRTASSEQVRRPIFKDGTDQWKQFEAHLEPLKKALGPTLETWEI
jgi:tetratricopeptide (TPR) repeat protein